MSKSTRSLEPQAPSVVKNSDISAASSTSDAPGQTIPHLLFDEVLGDFMLSIKGGPRCLSFPKELCASLEDYAQLEVTISSDRPEGVALESMGFPDEIARLFDPRFGAEANGITAGFVPRDRVPSVRQALLLALQNPNAGYPRGEIGWAKRTVFHNTSRAAAERIIAEGVKADLLTPGYFGTGFYVTPNAEYARSHYADSAEDEGAVIQCEIAAFPGMILDLRNPFDSETWLRADLDKSLGAEDFIRQAFARHRIAGIYDRSMEGLAIYDLSILRSFQIYSQEPDTRFIRSP